MMVIRGLSYQKGIFFIGQDHVACACDQEGQIIDWVKPLNGQTLMHMFVQVLSAMPLWFKAFTVLFFSLIFIPKLMIFLEFDLVWAGLPVYFLFYYLYGTHFMFPNQLRRYHGAEHKVFSYRGIKHRSRIYPIKKAAITNRYCSTNLVVIYFSLVVVLAGTLTFFISWNDAVTWASYSSFLIVPVINKLLHFRWMKPIRSYVLRVSYFLQETITTEVPERTHLLTAIQSYRKLAEVEFPDKLTAHKKNNKNKKEEKRVAIVDVTVIPIGTKTASVSDHVSEIHNVLASYGEKINYKLTPMSTIIEGELPVLFEVIQAIHEVPFQAGVERVATNIRIDDRRDKKLTMDGKIAAVEHNLDTSRTAEE